MYCPKCGTQNDDNAFRCIKCGTIIQQTMQRTVPAKSNTTAIVLIALGSVFGVFIVIGGIGILAAIAIPQFNAYRVRSYNASAQADLMYAATAQEAYYIDNKTYTDSIEDLIRSDYGLTFNKGITIEVISGDEYSYKLIAFHEQGNIKYQLEGPGGTVEAYPE